MQDAILFWNAVALEANRVSFSDPAKAEQQGPTLSSRALAIVHLAMYDAYAGIVGGTDFPRYLAGAVVPVPAGASARDAVAGAAFATLAALYPAQRDFFVAQLSAFNQTDANTHTDPSFGFGSAVGTALLDLRQADPGAGYDGYRRSDQRFRHRADPDNPEQGFHAPFYGMHSRPFAVTERHALGRPYSTINTKKGKKALDPRYLAALREVRAKGIRPDLMATLPDKVAGPAGEASALALFARRRTAEETTIGIFWGYDGANRLGTPPRLYNQIVRQVAMKRSHPVMGKVNDEGQNARLFAFVNAALADAGILAWEQKYCHDFWRPVVGIREHDESFGPLAPDTPADKPDNSQSGIELGDGDPGWLPLGAPSTNLSTRKNFTPNFPAYPSGHATFGAAALHIARLFYGIADGDRSNDDLFDGLTFASEEFNGRNRDNQGTVRPRHARAFPGGLWQMIIENGISRVYLGVHWVFDALDLTVERGLVVPDVAITNDRIGGIGLGLRIAEDIFAAGNTRAPKLSDVRPTEPLPEVIQPAGLKGCVDAESKRATQAVEGRFLRGLSDR